MTPEQQTAIEKAWEKCRAAHERLEKISTDGKNAALINADQKRFDEIFCAHCEAVKQAEAAQKELEFAHKEAGINIP